MIGKADEASQSSVTAFLGKVADAWKTNDGAAFADFFTEDGSLINPFGERADGRAAVAAMYTEYFDGTLRGTTTAVSLTALRTIGDDHAFADADQVIYSVNGEVVLAVHLASLLRRQGGEWRFVDARPYAFPPPPQAAEET